MFIAIEGPVGIGKSSIQNLLAKHLDADVLVQSFENHPYLELFYKDQASYRIETMMIFLFMGFHQLNHFQSNKKLTISDFIFGKYEIFARLTLTEDEFRDIFVPSYMKLKALLPKPDLVIWLRASPITVLNRIKNRGREMEQGVDPAYLTRMDNLYAEHFGTSSYNILEIDANENIVDPDSLEFITILQTIKGHLAQ